MTNPLNDKDLDNVARYNNIYDEWSIVKINLRTTFL